MRVQKESTRKKSGRAKRGFCEAKLLKVPLKKNPVAIALRNHLFPYRTQKLSSIASMVLGGRPPGRVERCRISFFKKETQNASIAQLAEHLTVNQRVTGSSPVGSATLTAQRVCAVLCHTIYKVENGAQTGSSPVGSAKKADNHAVYQLFSLVSVDCIYRTFQSFYSNSTI